MEPRLCPALETGAAVGSGHSVGGSTAPPTCVQVRLAHEGRQHLGHGHGLFVVVLVDHAEGLSAVPLPRGVKLAGGLQSLRRRWKVARAAWERNCVAVTPQPLSVPAGPAPCCRYSRSCHSPSPAHPGSRCSLSKVPPGADPARHGAPRSCRRRPAPVPPRHGCLWDPGVTAKPRDRPQEWECGSRGVPYPRRGGSQGSAPAWPGPPMALGHRPPQPGTGPGCPGPRCTGKFWESRRPLQSKEWKDDRVWGQ